MSDDKNDIARYLNNEMTSGERHQFEKRMLNDPFLAEAVEGAASIPPEEFHEDVRSLSQQLRDQRDNAWGMTLRIAAGVVLVFVVGWMAYRGNSPEVKEKLASLKEDSTSRDQQDTRQGNRPDCRLHDIYGWFRSNYSTCTCNRY